MVSNEGNDVSGEKKKRKKNVRKREQEKLAVIGFNASFSRSFAKSCPNVKLLLFRRFAFELPLRKTKKKKFPLFEVPFFFF